MGKNNVPNHQPDKNWDLIKNQSGDFTNGEWRTTGGYNSENLENRLYGDSVSIYDDFMRCFITFPSGGKDPGVFYGGFFVAMGLLSWKIPIEIG